MANAKKITITLVILTLMLIIIQIFINNKENKSLEIRTAIRYSNILKLDNRKVNTLTEAFLLRQLFSSLVEYDNEGKLVTGIADVFYWRDSKLIFELKNKVILSNDKVLDEIDVYYSLMRMLMSDKIFKKMVCPKDIVKQLVDKCSGLYIENKKIILIPSQKNYNDLILPKLATVEFRILSKDSVLKNNLEEVDFKNSTGPYNLDEETDKLIILKANSKHFQFDPKMPDKVVIYKINSENIFSLFKDKKINLITSIDTIKQKSYAELINSNLKFQEFVTNNISVGFIQFSQKAIIDFTPIERFAISRKIEHLMLSSANYLQKKTIVFFQSYGEIYLVKDDFENLKEKRNIKQNITFSRKPIIGGLSKNKLIWDDFQKINPEFNIKLYDEIPFNLSQFSRPDAMTAVTDFSFNEDISHLSFLLNQGYFGLYDINASSWLDQYLNLNNKTERDKYLAKLQSKALKNCYIYPVYTKPFVVLADLNWKLNQSKFQATTLIWKMRIVNANIFENLGL